MRDRVTIAREYVEAHKTLQELQDEIIVEIGERVDAHLRAAKVSVKIRETPEYEAFKKLELEKHESVAELEERMLKARENPFGQFTYGEGTGREPSWRFNETR